MEVTRRPAAGLSDSPQISVRTISGVLQYDGVLRRALPEFRLQFFAQERTEPATPRKRRREREEGRVAKSNDLDAAVIILVGLFVVLVLGNWMKDGLVENIRSVIRYMGDRAFHQSDWGMTLGLESLKRFLVIWGPVALASGLSAFAVVVSQVGFELTTKPLTPRFDRLNPVSGMKKILSLRSIAEMVKGLFKASLFGIVLYSALKNETAGFIEAIRYPVDSGIGVIADRVWALCAKFAFLLLVIALFDYVYQRWEFERSIRMSKQEIKEEYKQMEGDPMLKSKIRQKQREIARKRMMAAVPKADVVITNPTTLAIALQYDRKVMEAPEVVAKGKGFLARRIRAIAEESGVPVIENVPLARALYRELEIGDSIPESLYKAVAEVLAFVYRIKRAEGTRRSGNSPVQYGRRG
jgi:flagellar biosynthetic protein FlhB